MVLDESRPLLSKLAQLAPKLNKATDRYTAELKEIEAALAALNLGVETELGESFFNSGPAKFFDTNGNERVEEQAFSLGYGRYGEEWRILAIKYEHEIQEDNWTRMDGDTKPLLECSRKLRIAAAEHIPSLLKKVEEEAEEKITLLEKFSDR